MSRSAQGRAVSRDVHRQGCPRLVDRDVASGIDLLAPRRLGVFLRVLRVAPITLRQRGGGVADHDEGIEEPFFLRRYDLVLPRGNDEQDVGHLADREGPAMSLELTGGGLRELETKLQAAELS